jgi:hypothetical protein
MIQSKRSKNDEYLNQRKETNNRSLLRYLITPERDQKNTKLFKETQKLASLVISSAYAPLSLTALYSTEVFPMNRSSEVYPICCHVSSLIGPNPYLTLNC